MNQNNLNLNNQNLQQNNQIVVNQKPSIPSKTLKGIYANIACSITIYDISKEMAKNDIVHDIIDVRSKPLNMGNNSKPSTTRRYSYLNIPCYEQNGKFIEYSDFFHQLPKELDSNIQNTAIREENTCVSKKSGYKYNCIRTSIPAVISIANQMPIVGLIQYISRKNNPNKMKHRSFKPIKHLNDEKEHLIIGLLKWCQIMQDKTRETNNYALWNDTYRNLDGKRHAKIWENSFIG